MSVVNDKYIDDNNFFPDFDDDKMIYGEDDGVYYKYPNRITEENKLEVECFDAQNNSNDYMRVDGMEYGTSIREEYSEDDELAFTIPREEYEKLLNGIKTKYPDLKYNEDECKNLWGDGWGEFDDLTKELCMAIKAAFSVNVAYRHIDWFCDEIGVKTTNRNYNGWGD